MLMDISSAWATKLLSKLITRNVQAKMGRNVNVQIRSISLKSDDRDNVVLHVDALASITKQDLQELLLNKQ